MLVVNELLTFASRSELGPECMVDCIQPSKGLLYNTPQPTRPIWSLYPFTHRLLSIYAFNSTSTLSATSYGLFSRSLSLLGPLCVLSIWQAK